MLTQVVQQEPLEGSLALGGVYTHPRADWPCYLKTHPQPDFTQGVPMIDPKGCLEHLVSSGIFTSVNIMEFSCWQLLSLAFFLEQGL